MDPLRFREPYLRRQVQSQQQSLSSGQGYYTVESLEGLTSLPLLKSGPPAYPPPHLASQQDAIMQANRERLLIAEREALLRDLHVGRGETADPRTRFLAAERRESMLKNLPTSEEDPRLRLLAAADRDALLRNMRGEAGHVRTRLLATERDPLLRSFPGEPQARAFTEAETRVMGLSGRRILPDVDMRGAGFDTGLPHPRPRAPGIHDDRLRAPLVRDALTLHAQERAPPPELRRGVRSAPRPTDPMKPFSHFHANGSRVTKGVRSANNEIPKPAEKSNQQMPWSLSLANKSKTPHNKTKVPPEQSEGWCAVCKVHCTSAKNLQSHLGGKKHKEKLEEGRGGGGGGEVGEGKTSEPAVPISKEKLQGGGGEGKTNELVQTVTKEESSSKAVLLEGDASLADDQKRASDGKVSSEAKAERKRANKEEPEGTQGSTKRLKMVSVTDVAGTAAAQIAASKVVADKPAVPPSTGSSKMATPNPSHPVCKICNIFTTSPKNLEIHLKGKRHAARVQELKEEGKAV